jgi:hypothetical protein
VPEGQAGASKGSLGQACVHGPSGSLFIALHTMTKCVLPMAQETLSTLGRTLVSVPAEYYHSM